MDEPEEKPDRCEYCDKETEVELFQGWAGSSWLCDECMATAAMAE